MSVWSGFAGVHAINRAAFSTFPVFLFLFWAADDRKRDWNHDFSNRQLDNRVRLDSS